MQNDQINMKYFDVFWFALTAYVISFFIQVVIIEDLKKSILYFIVIILNLVFFKKFKSRLSLLNALFWLLLFYINKDINFISFNLVLALLVFCYAHYKFIHDPNVSRQNIKYVLHFICINYFLSGLNKLFSPAWLSGDALKQILNSNAAKEFSSHLIFDLAKNSDLLIYLSVLLIFAEISAYFVYFFASRKVFLTVFFLMHFVFLLSLNVFFISYPYLIFYALLLADCPNTEEPKEHVK